MAISQFSDLGVVRRVVTYLSPPSTDSPAPSSVTNSSTSTIKLRSESGAKNTSCVSGTCRSSLRDPVRDASRTSRKGSEYMQDRRRRRGLGFLPGIDQLGGKGGSDGAAKEGLGGRHCGCIWSQWVMDEARRTRARERDGGRSRRARFLNCGAVLAMGGRRRAGARARAVDACGRGQAQVTEDLPI